ncbi:MAG: hypothetical protein JJE04_08800 [Acidobacteriia bacterium]|nr:hypothetical protein [Terriglobia bacterium]
MRYAASNVTTAIMFGLTVYLMVARFKSRQDWIWPLFYYLFLVIYHQSFPGKLHPWVVYLGVVTALLIRFEFLPPRLNNAVRTIEFLGLSFLAYSFFRAVST